MAEEVKQRFEALARVSEAERFLSVSRATVYALWDAASFSM